LVHVFHDGVAYQLVRSNEHSFSTFGGPLELDITGQNFGPRRLHKIARLSFHEIPVLGPPRYVFEIPLVYGMCYSGCRMDYKFQKSGIDVLKIEPPTSSEDCPYIDYPHLLPFAPLRIGEKRHCSWEAFAEDLPNVSYEQPAELIAVVPPAMTLGVSMWGEHGDAEGVALVFECDLNEKRITTYNACS
jgi:hypothetical protein